ncbi:hypothetical protein ElyMa_000235000 [Elysia marginata]|uniref:IgGFc-binding protein N-terminal domain-containing protein n=1 Tax=Elysia marginata TaxID=1093978 RepID=A0AAV4F0J3_9GAST|nr:hypothetical protein ElyMa_000235000 [Elysia marginata]
MGNQEADGFVALPVNSWDTVYRPVTYWIEFGGQTVLNVIADVPVSVEITIPAQDSNHLYIFDTIGPANAETVLVNLEHGQVYQLRRNYDISGRY